MKKKALLIDDSVTIHRVIDLSIDSEKFEIAKVFSAEEADLKLSAESFDYILLDNKLEGVSISDYVAKLKNIQPSAGIVLLVGAFDRFGENELINSGADDYLIKPFDSQSLNQKLNGADSSGSETADIYGADESEDSMPAGFVERIPEADRERETDNTDFAPAPITGPADETAMNRFPMEEDYLDSLEDVHPDDMLEEGYVEDAQTLDDFSDITEIPEPEVLADGIFDENAEEEPENRADLDPGSVEEAEFDGIGEIPAESVTEAPPVYEDKAPSDISLETADLNGSFEAPEEFENSGLEALASDPEEIFSLGDSKPIAQESKPLTDNFTAAVLQETDNPLEEISEYDRNESPAESSEDDLNVLYDSGEFSEHPDETAKSYPKVEEGQSKEFFKKYGDNFDNISTRPEQSYTSSLRNTAVSENIVRDIPEERKEISSFSISISKSEIMSIIGAAIDKKVLEQAVHDAIATHMGEIVNSIVPALAEKYIKEEIERLKNDD